MRSISECTFINSLLLISALASTFAQQSPTPSLVLKKLIPIGCFSSSAPLKDQGPWTFQTPGYCQIVCVKIGKPVMGTTKGSNCWCGDLIPAADTKVPDSQCSSTCDGYDQDFCGGPNTWSVQLTGLENTVGNFNGGASNTSSSGSTQTTSAAATDASTSTPQPDSAKTLPPSIITHASTVVVTAPGQTKALQPSSTGGKSSGTSKAGVAAGAVVGVVAACALAGGLFFFIRHRKRRALEDNFHQNPTGAPNLSHKPTTSSSISDSRLEPSVMMQRRQSDGSIADNQDYSRRILKVTNPDGS